MHGGGHRADGREGHYFQRLAARIRIILRECSGREIRHEGGKSSYSEDLKGPRSVDTAKRAVAGVPRDAEYVSFKDRGRVAQLVEQCPFKAWVAGSSPAALTMISRYLEDFGGVDFGHPRTPRTVSTQLGQPFALSISWKISPAAPSGRPSCVLSAGRRKPLVRRVPRLSWGWCDEVAIVRPSHSRRLRSAM